jgi:uncharacterized protein YndB with AHSA1/START domain
VIDPIRRSVMVTCSVKKAFEVFTEGMGMWWPVRELSRAADRDEAEVKTERVVVEPWEGGRIYETMSDGSEGSWGTILTWVPPHRLVMAWKPNLTALPPTEVEIQFIEQDDGRTRVDLEHRGWERLGDLGRTGRDGYAGGWALVFEERFAAAANGAA